MGKSKTSKSEHARLNFPVGRIGSALKKGRYAQRISVQAAVFFAAVLESCTQELMELSQGVAAENGRRTIKPRHITLAVREDPSLDKLLSKVTIAQGGVRPAVHPAVATNLKSSSKKQVKSKEKSKKTKSDKSKKTKKIKVAKKK